MLKKLLIASAVLAISSTAFAECGPYVGASVGINDNLNQYRVSHSDTDSSGSDSYNFGTRGANFNLFAGYGAMVGCNVWLGGEVFGNYASNNTNIISTNRTETIPDIFTGVPIGSVSTSVSAKIQQRWSYGASVLPGLMVLDHTLVYARLGVVETRFNNTVNVTASFSGPDGSGSISLSDNNNKNAFGYQAGVGFQTAISPCVDLRGEYVYTGYRSYNVGRGSNARITPSNDQFNVGLVYKFG